MNLEQSDKIFQQRIAKQRITTYDGVIWEYYDTGRLCKSISTNQESLFPPLIFLSGLFSSPRCFHYQMDAFAKKGYRTIAIQHPVVWSHDEWIHSFDRLLNAMDLKQIHIYGDSLGGYLAQRYAVQYPDRILSLVLTQSFVNATEYQRNIVWLKSLPMLPEVYLRSYLLQYFPSNIQEWGLKDGQAIINYIQKQVELLSKDQIASRLTLLCQSTTDNQLTCPLPDTKLTLLDTHECVGIPAHMKEDIEKTYPQSKRAILRKAGPFPFLSQPEAVTMHLQVHLRHNGAFIA